MRRRVDTEKARRAEAEAEREQHMAEIARLSAELEATKKALELGWSSAAAAGACFCHHAVATRDGRWE